MTSAKTLEFNLLYSGTIAKAYGIFEAIELSKKLYENDSSIRLTIIGYCAKKSDLLRLKHEIQGLDFVTLIGGDHLVPHSEIVNEIKKANFGLHGSFVTQNKWIFLLRTDDNTFQSI
mgnify:CR=1 FL=1